MKKTHLIIALYVDDWSWFVITWVFFQKKCWYFKSIWYEESWRDLLHFRPADHLKLYTLLDSHLLVEVYSIHFEAT